MDFATPLKPVTRLRLASCSRASGLLLLALGVMAVALLSLRIGAVSVSTGDAVRALFDYDQSSYDQTVVRSLRVPRTAIGLAVGAALAMAGAIMQAVTRNPLADPSILGVNTGASFAIVTAIFVFGLGSAEQYVWFGFAGALASALLVYVVASAGRGGATPVKLVLAGVVVTGLLSSWISALLLLDEQALDLVRFWLAGSLAGRELGVLWMVLPFLALGLFTGLLLSRQLNVMSLGEDTAKAMGLHTGRVRLVSSMVVVVVTGAAVAAAGPIGFVGLAIPHIVRLAVGPDYRWILPYSALCGPILLLGADIVGRMVVRPTELPVGMVTAACGAPFLIILARSRRVGSL